MSEAEDFYDKLLASLGQSTSRAAPAADPEPELQPEADPVHEPTPAATPDPPRLLEQREDKEQDPVQEGPLARQAADPVPERTNKTASPALASPPLPTPPPAAEEEEKNGKNGLITLPIVDSRETSVPAVPVVIDLEDAAPATNQSMMKDALAQEKELRAKLLAARDNKRKQTATPRPSSATPSGAVPANTGVAPTIERERSKSISTTPKAHQPKVKTPVKLELILPFPMFNDKTLAMKTELVPLTTTVSDILRMLKRMGPGDHLHVISRRKRAKDTGVQVVPEGFRIYREREKEKVQGWADLARARAGHPDPAPEMIQSLLEDIPESEIIDGVITCEVLSGRHSDGEGMGDSGDSGGEDEEDWDDEEGSWDDSAAFWPPDQTFWGGGGPQWQGWGGNGSGSMSASSPATPWYGVTAGPSPGPNTAFGPPTPNSFFPPQNVPQNDMHPAARWLPGHPDYQAAGMAFGFHGPPTTLQMGQQFPQQSPPMIPLGPRGSISAGPQTPLPHDIQGLGLQMSPRPIPTGPGPITSGPGPRPTNNAPAGAPLGPAASRSPVVSRRNTEPDLMEIIVAKDKEKAMAREREIRARREEEQRGEGSSGRAGSALSGGQGQQDNNSGGGGGGSGGGGGGGKKRKKKTSYKGNPRDSKKRATGGQGGQGKKK